MAQPTIISKSTKVEYGTSDKVTFSIHFPTLEHYYPLGVKTEKNPPTAGTIIVAGISVTLEAGDIVNLNAVARKIASSSITGYTVHYNEKTHPFEITLVNNSVGPQTLPTIVLGTATNILFSREKAVVGVSFPTVGALEDLYLRGKYPGVISITYAGETCPDLQFANGTLFDQSRGGLSYGPAVTLSIINGIINSFALDKPMNFARITTKTDNTRASVSFIF